MSSFRLRKNTRYEERGEGLIDRDKFGVSRLRVAEGEQLPEGSSAVALTPIGKSTLLCSDTKLTNRRINDPRIPIETTTKQG